MLVGQLLRRSSPRHYILGEKCRLYLGRRSSLGHFFHVFPLGHSLDCAGQIHVK
jgi:hypothetical protein